MENFIYGVNPVRELLRRRAERVKEIVTSRKEQGLEEIIGLAAQKGVKVVFKFREELDQITGSQEHQGIAAKAPLPEPVLIEDILEKTAQKDSGLILFLDQIEDPQNLGAIIRSAECAGADGVVIPEHRGAAITPAVVKASAGALEWIPLAIVTNLTRALEKVKEFEFWTYAAVMGAKENLWQTQFSKKAGIVVGSEGKGIRPLVARTCDFQVSIPLHGKIESLNASVSAAVLLYEYRRQFPAA